MSIDVDALREETPGCRHRNHLNNAGAALQPEPVIAAVSEHLDLEARIGGYEAADDAREAIGEVYGALGRLLGCHAANVAVVENATAGFAQAVSAVSFQPGDVLVTTRNDYTSNQIQYLALAERYGVEVVRAPDAPVGGVDVGAFEEIVHRRRPRLVAVTHVPTNSGLVQDVSALARICRSREILCLVDACQSVGQMPVDVEDIPCDFLSGTSRKFLRGPRGVGFLYVSDRALDLGLEPLLPDMHGAEWIAEDLYQPAPDASRFENWEFPWALVLGLGEAARYALDVGLSVAGDRARRLADRLRAGLAALPGATVLDRGRERCAIVTAHFEGHEPPDLVEALRIRGINTSSASIHAGLLDFRDKGVDGALRLSPHYYNTEGEIDDAVAALAEIVA